jgi:site-specific DNA-methyltransferase (adenine-specific)
MESVVSSRQQFGLPTTFHGKKNKQPEDILIFDNNGTSFTTREKITKNLDIVDKFKVFIPRASSGSDSFPHQIFWKTIYGRTSDNLLRNIHFYRFI